MLKGILISIILTCSWVLAQAAVFRLRRPEKMFRASLALFLATFSFLPVVYLLSPADLWFLPRVWSRSPTPLGLLDGLIVHFLFFFTYMAFFYYITRSVTLRILLETLDLDGKETGCEELKKRYNVRTMVLLRLDAMEANGFIRRRGERYVNTAKGRRYARLFALCRRVFSTGV